MISLEKEYNNIVELPNGFCDISEHLPTLRRYGKECNFIIELGVRTGASTVGLLNSKPQKMISYDIKILPEAIGIANQAKLEGIDFNLVEANDLEIDIPECDLLFIDTDHTEPQLKAELERHGNKARKYIILHDTVILGLLSMEPSKRGLLFALIPWLEQNKHWVIREHLTNCNGLTILARI